MQKPAYDNASLYRIAAILAIVGLFQIFFYDPHALNANANQDSKRSHQFIDFGLKGIKS
jgi:hypothetical protein